MNPSALDYLICPQCASAELSVEPYCTEGDDIREGRLICRSCGAWHRIENGIGDLLPVGLRSRERYEKFALRYGIRVGEERSEEPASGKVSQAAFFEERAAVYDKCVVQGNYALALDRLFFLDWVEKNLKRGMQVLALGCGTGRQCIPLARRGIRTIGIDIAEGMLRICKVKVDALGLMNHVDLFVGDAEAPPVRKGAFDAAVLYAILHHLPDKQQAVRGASRALGPGGRFLSLDPHASPVRFIFEFMMKIWKLWESHAGDEPLLSETQLQGWLFDAGIAAATRLSTYLPPHIFNMLNCESGVRLLRCSDAFLSRVPLLRKLAGIVVAEGEREEVGEGPEQRHCLKRACSI